MQEASWLCFVEYGTEVFQLGLLLEDLQFSCVNVLLLFLVLNNVENIQGFHDFL